MPTILLGFGSQECVAPVHYNVAVLIDLRLSQESRGEMSIATCKAGRATNVCEMYSIVHVLI